MTLNFDIVTLMKFKDQSKLVVSVWDIMSTWLMGFEFLLWKVYKKDTRL